MKGIFVVNNYYTDSGIEYVFSRLKEEFEKLGATLEKITCPHLIYNEKGEASVDVDADFAVFWNKDSAVAKILEKKMPVFNSGRAIEVCDDKAKTFLEVEGKGVLMPKTITAPIRYDINKTIDENFLFFCEKELSFPIVVKENTGSQGRQVYLASSRAELWELSQKLMHVPHILQQYVADERGVDIRIYVVGGKAIASCKRKNTTGFKSNVHMGGVAENYEASKQLKEQAELIASALSLDYGSVDFLTEKGHFVEANSNAYFKAIESLGYDIAGAYARHIKKVTEKRNARKD